MVINESGLCKAMAAAYKSGGYEIIPAADELRSGIILWGSSWAVRASMDDLPRKALGLLAEHAGCIPADPIMVKKDEPNQSILPEVARNYIQSLCLPYGVPLAGMIPVIYKDIWQLYRKRSGGVIGISRNLLDIVTPETRAEQLPVIYEDSTLVHWTFGNEDVYICRAYWRQDTDQPVMEQLARMDWSPAAQ